MKLLLDTHVALWAISDSKELDERKRKLISDTSNDVFVSIVSIWEVEIKHEKYPSVFTISAKEFADYCRRSGYNILNLAIHHLTRLEELKLKGRGIHQDPFDHIIMAQADYEEMTLVTDDENIKGYDGFPLI